MNHATKEAVSTAAVKNGSYERYYRTYLWNSYHQINKRKFVVTYATKPDGILSSFPLFSVEQGVISEVLRNYRLTCFQYVYLTMTTPSGMQTYMIKDVKFAYEK